MKMLFQGDFGDKAYLPYLKGLVGTATVYIRLEAVNTITELVMYCQQREIKSVITTNRALLSKLLGTDGARKSPSLDSYAGSLFSRDGIEFVFINPLEHLVKVPYGKFLAARFISKLSAPQNWFQPPEFNWEIANASNIDRIFNDYQSAFLIAVDIETFKSPLSIRCVGYTAIFLNGDGSFRSHSCVFPIDSEYFLGWMRRFNWDLKAPKIFQNGKYDNAYLSRFNAPIYNYLWDTATAFHCWYSELPKDLGFLGSFFVREAMYWKDLANTNDLEQYYLYNCRDHWTTACVMLAWFLEAPDFAFENYELEFPLIFPCHLSEMTGMKRDAARMKSARAEIDLKIASLSASLDTMLGVKNFNVNSPVQMKALAKILGLGSYETVGKIKQYVPVESMDEKHCAKYSYLHPLNGRILGETGVLGIRGYRKLKSTYLRTDEDAKQTGIHAGEGGSKEFGGRILYALNPHGTDTGRLASREHHFWCGLQIQNIPRGNEVKQTVVADDGFLFGECDLEQAESRDTGYISGDERIIAAVSSVQDFHSLNVVAFFGRKYEDIYDDTLRKTKNKTLRDLSKRVNHGANYNMGPNVLVDTMGLKEIEQARKLLGLPGIWTHKQIAEYLLEQFNKAYPSLKKVYYPDVIHRVESSRLLVGATGWTRYCFGSPRTNKADLNAYVAHCPQSLNAMVLNMAYMKVFYELAMAPDSRNNFKLCAQIHDSILFQFREGHEYLCERVKRAMEIPVTITGADGKVRTFTVPAAIKAGKDGHGAKYWDQTE
jgi:DNA polymerase I-like protein with 3'-5' exonuclease and polymerase domains